MIARFHQTQSRRLWLGLLVFRIRVKLEQVSLRVLLLLSIGFFGLQLFCDHLVDLGHAGSRARAILGGVTFAIAIVAGGVAEAHALSTRRESLPWWKRREAKLSPTR